MVLIGAGMTAVIAAFFANRIALKVFGSPVMVVLAPLVEEVAKTASALLWQTGLLETHLFFGVVEACYDIWGGGKRVVAPLLSLGGHGFFGYITYLGLSLTGSFLWGLAAGVLLHSVWNGVVIKIVEGRQRR